MKRLPGEAVMSHLRISLDKKLSESAVTGLPKKIANGFRLVGYVVYIGDGKSVAHGLFGLQVVF